MTATTKIGRDAAVSELGLRQIGKKYGQVVAVDKLDLDVSKGDLVALLGPSGCGKTTTLRMLAGFEVPSTGQVWIRGEDVTRLPPHRRDTAMVFQNYALFPHLSVFDNVAYGLRRRGVRGAALRSRVEDMLAKLAIEHLAQRRPAKLSGGQQQRVAVGRALAVEPAVLLLDEPFSALDAQLREQTRIELRRLQLETGVTAVFVTHDQQEALAIADRVVVMNGGRVEQEGTPQDVYERPGTRFVAGFIGAANLLLGHVVAAEGQLLTIRTDDGMQLRAKSGVVSVGARVTAAIRAEDVNVGAQGEFHAKVEVSSYLGSGAELRLRLAEGSALSVRGPRQLAGEYQPGSSVQVNWPVEAVRLLTA
jgi:ABC-type Fe3+/spermidine/putrescine transport system ATPase subunit